MFFPEARHAECSAGTAAGSIRGGGCLQGCCARLSLRYPQIHPPVRYPALVYIRSNMSALLSSSFSLLSHSTTVCLPHLLPLFLLGDLCPPSFSIPFTPIHPPLNRLPLDLPPPVCAPHLPPTPSPQGWGGGGSQGSLMHLPWQELDQDVWLLAMTFSWLVFSAVWGQQDTFSEKLYLSHWQMTLGRRVRGRGKCERGMDEEMESSWWYPTVTFMCLQTP